ncbi:MAG: hypothetical protein ACKVOH_00665 [Chlamydiales bacterium]
MYLDINAIGDISTLDNFRIINSPARHQYQSQGCKKIFLRQTAKRVHDTFLDLVIGKIAPAVPAAQAKKVFAQALASRQIVWKKSDTLTGAKLKAIAQVFAEAVSHSEGVFVNVEGNPTTPVQAFSDFLVRKRERVEGKLLQAKMLKTVVVERDAAFMTDFRGELQGALDEAFEQRARVSPEAMQTFVHYILSLIPFTYPEINSRWTIPIMRNAQWEQVEYTIEQKFDLSPACLSSPLPAYALIAGGDTPPILACLGSTYPAGDGFIATWMSDCTPGLSVGKAPVLYGKAALAVWFQGKQNVKVVGTSLGGAIALQMLRYFGDKVGEVHAVNPAGLHPWDSYGEQHAQVFIYSQWGDAVSTMGYFPRNAQIWRIVKDGKDENFILAHARGYSGGAVTIFKSTVVYEHHRKDRALLTGLHIALSPILFSILFSLNAIKRIIEELYNFLTAKALAGQKVSNEDLCALVTCIAVGALLISLGVTMLALQSKSPLFTRALSQVGQKGYVGISAATITFGGMLVLPTLSHTKRRFFPVAAST